jgi:hypothetical protein
VALPSLNTKSTSSLAYRAANYFRMRGTGEFTLAMTLCALLIFLRIVNLLHHRFDSDEPQHLHVIWSWTQGLVQYRDVFDNHMPLFHIMLAPIAGLIGERATILYWMRFVLLPLYFVSAWATYQIGARLFSKRVGIWSAIGAGFFPSYHFMTLEFRPDNLWAALWLLFLWVLVAGPIDRRRGLVAGLLLGLCLVVSMKSVLVLISLLLSTFLLALVGRGKSAIHVAQCGAILFTVAACIPAVVVLFFWAKGLWPDFLYCVFGHQFFPRLYQRRQGMFAAISLLLIPAVFCVARRVFAAASAPELGLRRAFVLLITSSYLLILWAAWPLIARTDYLLVYPTAFVLLTGALFAITEQGRFFGWYGSRSLQSSLPALVSICELFVLLQMQPLWRDNTRTETKLLYDILNLTTARDYVLDCKGETVFRQRPFWPVLETITRKRIQQGLILDNTPQRCIETGTCVAATIMIERLSPGTEDFVVRNYLPVTEGLRVAGVELSPSPEKLGHFDFEVVIPASYKIVSANGPVRGTLDGAPCDGARFLTSGPHTFDSRLAFGRIFCVWAQAVERNFTPFEFPDK